MSLRRALVVDDSKVARLALKKQLEEYDIVADLADSGEEALEFLKENDVDVIFMDHIMPGMDGLEAVTALKSNPSTATIPVMMYTSKEGELYVSQARALGAVDVLPKQVQPGVLFGMLLKLGLVRDRRAPQVEVLTELAELSDEKRAEIGEEPPLGIPMPNVLTRIIEDQHITLRSEIRKGQRRFAKQVASEILEQQKAEQLASPNIGKLGSSHNVLSVSTAVLAVIVLLLGTLLLQARTDRDAAKNDLARLAAATEQERLSSKALNEQLTSAIGTEQTRSELATREMLDTMTWAINETGSVPYGEMPFNETRIEQIRELVTQLMDVDFLGIVRVESHLGEYCLESDATGVYRPVDPDLPFTSCALIGHPLDESSLLSDRQTPGFEAFLNRSPLINGSGIELEVVVRDRMDSVPLVPYPEYPMTAGVWNRIAAQNNRLEYSIVEGSITN